MGHDHSHSRDAGGHSHTGHDEQVDPSADLSLPDSELSPADLSRRRFLRNVGIVGAATATASTVGLQSAAPAAAAFPRPTRGGGDSYLWSAGDHHIHTQYSGGADAPYRIDQQVEHGARFGLGWVVITDHGGVNHQKFGVGKTYGDILLARRQNKDMLVFQGLEWNPPAGDHSTVFVQPGPNEAEVLKQFEGLYDARVPSSGATGASTPANEAKAVEAVKWLSDQVKAGRVGGALQVLHHASRSGLYSPHEMRNLRDAAPGVAIGMEGAPGHQAACIPKSQGGAGAGRGFYDNGPGTNSFAGYPLSSYRTFGGFDWLTATVGGVWDSLLAEGKPYWVTATSDSHQVYDDSWRYGGAMTPDGTYPDPVFTRTPIAGRGDFWPGQYSRTHVGMKDFTYGGLMDGLRAGRVWVDHGQLIDSLAVSVAGNGQQAPGTFGDTVVVERGKRVDVTVRIGLPSIPNFNGESPRLRRVDLIAGPITGPASDRDALSAPGTRVVHSWEVGGKPGQELVLTYRFAKADGPFYLRLRGTDGNVSAPGSIEPRQDPYDESAPDNGFDPWQDLWFYSNPVFVQDSGRPRNR